MDVIARIRRIVASTGDDPFAFARRHSLSSGFVKALEAGSGWPITCTHLSVVAGVAGTSVSALVAPTSEWDHDDEDHDERITG